MEDMEDTKDPWFDMILSIVCMGLAFFLILILTIVKSTGGCMCRPRK